MALTKRTQLSLVILPFSLITSELSAQLVLDPPQPITHRVVINPIRSVSSTGEQATAFGNSAQEADIIDKINQIWAQVGIEIFFKPFLEFEDDFTFNNNGAGGTRPQGDLGRILNLSNIPARQSNSDIDMVFVQSAPGFGSLSQNTAAGLARVDRPGTTVYVGPRLLGFSRGRDVIASVVAHEVGHNLGLPHTAGRSPNLMASPGGPTEQISNDQVNRIFTNNRGIDGFDLVNDLDVEPPLSRYEQFVMARGLQPDPLADDDMDGLSNLLEFAIGSNPVAAGSRLPQISQVGPSEFRWSIPKTPDAIADGVSYRVSVSSDLENFSPAGSSGSNSRISTNNSDRITTRLFNADQGFFQLEVQLSQRVVQSRMTEVLAAQLAQEDEEGVLPDPKQRRCACGQEH